MVGDVLDSPNATDFTACVDLCSSHHPKCEGVSFDGSTCQLRATVDPSATHPSKTVDAAVAQFGTATSNCTALGGSQTAQGANFGTFCGFIINGSDLTQNFAPTFQDCMGQCVATSGCGAVSFDASQSQGFKNCYLKSQTSASGNIADQGIDTAVINAAAAANPAPSSSAAQPATSPSTTPAPTLTVATTATVVQTPATVTVASVDPGSTGGGGASFFTPPGSLTGGLGGTTPPVVSTRTVVSIVTSGSQTTAVTQVITVSAAPSGSPFLFGTNTAAAISSSATGATDAEATDGGGSRAWIAAPVVGSAAAVVLIVLMFVMLGRRRNAANGSRGSGGTSTSRSNGSGNGSGSGSRSRTKGRGMLGLGLPSPSASLFTTWLPGSPGRGKAAKMGNFSEVTGKKISPQSSAARNSVIGFWRPGTEKLEDIEEGSLEAEKKGFATPVYELRGGKAELRESMNGLSQHRWPVSSTSS